MYDSSTCDTAKRTIVALLLILVASDAIDHILPFSIFSIIFLKNENNCIYSK